jgi:hypothetical protein
VLWRLRNEWIRINRGMSGCPCLEYVRYFREGRTLGLQRFRYTWHHGVVWQHCPWNQSQGIGVPVGWVRSREQEMSMPTIYQSRSRPTCVGCWVHQRAFVIQPTLREYGLPKKIASFPELKWLRGIYFSQSIRSNKFFIKFFNHEKIF